MQAKDLIAILQENPEGWVYLDDGEDFALVAVAARPWEAGFTLATAQVADARILTHILDGNEMGDQ